MQIKAMKLSIFLIAALVLPLAAGAAVLGTESRADHIASEAAARTATKATSAQRVWEAHRNPVNRYLAVERGGRQYYFSADDWNNIPENERADCNNLGVVVNKDGQLFILGLNLAADGMNMAWDYAMNYFGNVMPTKEQGEAIASQIRDIAQAIGAFGGSMAGPIIWTKTECDATNAWAAYLALGNVSVTEKEFATKVRPVMKVES